MQKHDARIVFFGFGDVGYKCLKYMLENGYNLVAVFTHDCDAHEKHWFETPESIAKKFGVEVFKPKSLAGGQWAEVVKNLKPDLVLSLYYRNRIPEEVFSQARLGAYNLHGSYLPSYKGRAPLNWAIINGENYTGVSLHVLERDFDTGDVIARKKVEISDGDYVGDVQPKVSQAAVEMFVKTLPKMIDNTVVRLNQAQLEGESSYFGKRTPEMGRIDFSKSAREIRNLIRAVSRPFNGAFFDVGNKRYTVWRADVCPAIGGKAAGEIVDESGRKLVFAAKDGCLVSEDFEISDIVQGS